MGMGIECPKCGSRMDDIIYEGIKLLCCPEGHGHWVFGDALNDIVERRQEEIPQRYFDEVQSSGRVITDQRGVVLDVKCPQCGTLCQKINYSYSSGIIIDHCPNGCGIWLDAGELEKVQAFYEYWQANAKQFLEQSGAWDKIEEIQDEYQNDEEEERTGLGGLLNSLYNRFLGK